MIFDFQEAERRREAAKEWRDQQIRELSSLGPNRNQSQEEQLRTLKLDKEFERRAQEEEDDDDEDQVLFLSQVHTKENRGIVQVTIILLANVKI